MGGVRVLVGTRKGAFVLTADEERRSFDVDGPFFGGWEVNRVAGSPADPDRLWAAAHVDWFGQKVHRSDDGGRTWTPVDGTFAHEGDAGMRKGFDGTPEPFTFRRIWELRPSPDDADTLWLGAEDASLFRTTDGGATFTELPGLRQHPTTDEWQPGAGGLCLHTIVLHPDDPARMLVAISAAGVFRSEDGGATWSPSNTGLASGSIPDPDADVGHCVHKLALHPARPETVFMQKHWDVMRSDDGGRTWREVSGNLPSDFGFVVDVHAHDPDTVYVVPITSDSEHFPPEGRLRVHRSRTGGDTWEELGDGLPDGCWHDVLRDTLAVDRMPDCGLYVGTTGGDVWASADAGDTWAPIVRGLPRILSVEVQTL